MSREIEFKIFANGKWYYKCLVGNTNNTSDDNWTCPLVWSDEKKEWLHCDNGVICQYTGKKDNNGVKIFDNDIVKITIRNKTTVAQVKWLEKRCKWVFVCGEDWIGLEHFQIKSELEVIGNFYDYPY